MYVRSSYFMGNLERYVSPNGISTYSFRGEIPTTSHAHITYFMVIKLRIETKEHTYVHVYCEKPAARAKT